MNLLAKHLHSLATTTLHDMYSIDNRHAFGHYIFLYVETHKKYLVYQDLKKYQ